MAAATKPLHFGSCLRCEAADDVRRDVYLHGRRHMRSRISLRGCPAYSVVVRWESMERGDTTFGVRLVVYDRAASCAKWHVERQRKGGARGPPSGVLVCGVLPRAWRAPGEVGVSLGFAAY